jgi:hypothetical protein
MKAIFATIISGWIVLITSASPAYAQAPSSLAGDGFLAGISSGAYPLASYGYFLFIPANSGSAYQVIGIYNVINSSGTFTYTPTGASTATINANDSVGGQLVLSASFSSASSGSFFETAVSYPGAYQSGSFGFSSVNAPSSLAGRTFNCSIVSGASPFYTSGSYTITIASSGNTYTVSTGQTGTYSYSTLNRSTGMLQLNDSVTGATTAYFGFSSATGGGYAIKNSTGYQVGTFVLSDTTPPTVSISSPATAQTYTASQTVNITATASDNVGVARVDFYDGATFKGTDSAAPYTYDWSFTAADNGSHIWTARAYDDAGNSTLSISVTLTVSIDATPPTVTITSPTNGQVVKVAAVTVSGTATDPGSPASGVSDVEVRLNGGSWASATGTTSWNKALSLILGSNSIETRSRDNAGNYSAVSSCQVSFVDTNKPSLAITAPTAGQRWSNAVFTVTGTAGDNVQVSNVWYQINGLGWNPATSGNNWSNWTAQVTLTPGTNTITAYSMDTSGNCSLTNSVNFQYVVTNQLQVFMTGLGTNTPNYNNAWLEIGRNYSMTATPGTGFRFTNWTGSLVTSAATLNFTMDSNLTFTANFIDTNKPVFSITNLTAGQRWSNAMFTVRGTARDNWQVTNVWYQLNGQDWSNAVTANAWTNWSATLNLVPGTNLLQAYAADSSGNVSATTNLSFDFVVTNQLQIRTTGLGAIKPNYSNAWLEIGRNYSITSAPASGFVFTNWQVSTNWIGGVTVTGTNLQIMMQSNLTLQANFVDVTKPTLAITAPTSGQKMTNALVTGIGTASDNWQISNVWYQLNNGAWRLGTTANSFTNWTTPTLTLVAGTNLLKAYALDLGGNYSLTNSVSFVSSNTFLLQLAFTNALPMKTNGLVFNLQLSTGLNGQIQFSTNLTSWATLTNFVGTNSTLTFRDPAATNSSQRFYRAVIP